MTYVCTLLAVMIIIAALFGQSLLGQWCTTCLVVVSLWVQYLFGGCVTVGALPVWWLCHCG